MKINQGIIKWVVIIVIALIILGYFGFDIRRAIESPTTQSNFNYVQLIVYKVWNGFLKKPLAYLWKDVFLEIIWYPALNNLKKIGNNEPTVIDQKAPKLAEPNLIQ